MTARKIAPLPTPLPTLLILSPPSPPALAVLHRQGDMTDAEFAAARQRLLRQRAGSDPRAYRRRPARDAARRQKETAGALVPNTRAYYVTYVCTLPTWRVSILMSQHAHVSMLPSVHSVSNP